MSVEPEHHQDSDPVVVISRRSLRRVLIALVALLVLAGVGLAAFAVGRSTAPDSTSSAAKEHAVHGGTTTTAPATTTSAVPSTTTSLPPSTTTAPNPALAILAPATVPPVSAECTVTVTESADGNASPQLCANGGVNVQAWNWYRDSYGSILALGRTTTEASVIAAMCAASPPYPEIDNAAKLAGAYYGWSFADSSSLSTFPFSTGSTNECSG